MSDGLSVTGTLGVTGVITGLGDQNTFGTGGSVGTGAGLSGYSTQAGYIGTLAKHNTSAEYPLGAWNSATSGDNKFVVLYEGGGNERGSITYNRAGGVVLYNTTSDQNLKTLIGDADPSDSTAILKSTRLRSYYWNHDETQRPQIGPFAQELYQTYKGAVSVGGDDPTAEDYKTWGVDKTAFSFHLVAGWQDHEARLAALQAEFQSYKSSHP